MVKPAPRSQLLDLFLHVAAELGATSDRELARLAEVSPDNIANWKSGAVKELKTQTLETIKRNVGGRLAALRQQLRWLEWDSDAALIPMEVEEGSDPAALQRQFVDRMVYDYLGHRFLYFEPQGALAWENLIAAGYQQDCWLRGVDGSMKLWLDARSDGPGSARGRLAASLGLDGRSPVRGLDVVSLGPGEGSKEAAILAQLVRAQSDRRVLLPQLTVALVDVSIPLVLKAARAAKRIAAPEDVPSPVILPICADFEEGTLGFVQRLPSSTAAATARLVLILGNVFGNLRDEERFVQRELGRITRPGDLLWLEVGVRNDNIESDPLYPLTRPGSAETPAFTNRRLLLEGPYRRWEAALGRRQSELETRVSLHEGDDTCLVPGSVNFCHDLVLKEERRACTMLYSRRYQVEGLSRWLAAHGYEVVSVQTVMDDGGRQGVAHFLARRR